MATVLRKMKGFGFLLALMMNFFMMQQNVSAYADTERFGDYEIYSSQMTDELMLYSVFTPAAYLLSLRHRRLSKHADVISHRAGDYDLLLQIRRDRGG